MQLALVKQLPRKFGLAFDGWSDYGVHYVAVFAVGPGLPDIFDGCVLLGFSPLNKKMTYLNMLNIFLNCNRFITEI